MRCSYSEAMGGSYLIVPVKPWRCISSICLLSVGWHPPAAKDCYETRKFDGAKTRHKCGTVICIGIGLIVTGCGDRVPRDILAAMTPVCSGRAVSASPYRQDGVGPSPTVLLSSDGSRHRWTHRLPRDWWPSSPDEVQLVVVVDNKRRVHIETCAYRGGPPISGYR